MDTTHNSTAAAATNSNPKITDFHHIKASRNHYKANNLSKIKAQNLGNMKKIQQKQYKKIIKQNQLKKINNFRDTIDSISDWLCTNWFVVEPQSNSLNRNMDQNTNDITKLFGIYDTLPDSVYKFWFEKPEVQDPIYGLDQDCECPHLFVSMENGGYSPKIHKAMIKLYKVWGYFNEREIRHRCSMFAYMKAQRRCARPEFWEIFDLEDNFLVELQILAVHLWIIKTRMNSFASPVCNNLSYEMFRIMFNEFGVRFEKHISGSRIRWESDCQHACLYLATALDEVWDNYQINGNHYNPYIFAKVIWSEIYLLNENVSLDVLYLWSKYIYDQMMAIKKVSDFDFLNGWWKFGEIPTMEDREQTKYDIIKFKKMFENEEVSGDDMDDIDERLDELVNEQMMQSDDDEEGMERLAV